MPLVKSFSRITHMFSAKLCLNHVLDETVWNGHELRCPVCGQLVAYTYPSHGYHRLYVTYRYKDYYTSVLACSPAWVDQPIPKNDAITIDWDLLRIPIEPLLSDTWDDDASYQKCVQEYIQQVRNAEKQGQTPDVSASNTDTTE